MLRRPVRVLVSRALILAACSGAMCLPAQAQAAAPDAALDTDWRVALSFGGGSHDSELPTDRGTQRVARAPFPALGFELGILTPQRGALRFAGSAAYTTSLGNELERTIAPDTSERSAARKQELRGQAGAELALNVASQPVIVPFALGYALRALSTDAPLVVPAAYALSGPYAQMAAAALRLGTAWETRLGYRQAHAVIPLEGAGSFRDRHAWLFVSVALHE